MFSPYRGPQAPPLPPIPAEVRIDVLDASNKNRVLGSLPRCALPHGPAKARAVVFAIQPRVTMWSEPTFPDVPLNRMQIALEFDERVEDEGFVIRAVLKTSACISDLVHIRGFRLPKETVEEAAHRLRYL